MSHDLRETQTQTHTHLLSHLVNRTHSLVFVPAAVDECQYESHTIINFFTVSVHSNENLFEAWG